jgi:site-specific DNA recombinase
MTMQVEHCMKTISDIGEMYSNTDAAIQREIAGSIFPEYIVFSNKKVRTVRINEVIKLLCPSIVRYETKKRGQKSEKSALSSLVDYTIEPLARRSQISNLDLVEDLAEIIDYMSFT